MALHFILLIFTLISLIRNEIFPNSTNSTFRLNEWGTPGDFKDGTFGLYNLSRVPFLPPSTKSIKIVKYGKEFMVLYRLRVTDPYRALKSRNEVTVSDDFFMKQNGIYHGQFSTIIPSRGIWVNPQSNASAAVLAQFYDGKHLGHRSPPIALRFNNQKTIQITLERLDCRKIVYEGEPIYDRSFTLRFEHKWNMDGFLKVFLDEKMIVDFKGQVGYADGDDYFFKFGIYDAINFDVIPKDFVLTLYHGAYYQKRLK